MKPRPIGIKRRSLLPIGRICRPSAGVNPLDSAPSALAWSCCNEQVSSSAGPLRKMRVLTAALFGLALCAPLWPWTPARADVRVKDIADVEGIRQNQLIGYGLVVGLNGTGDKLNNNVFTRESLIGMLERLGVNTRDQVTALSTKNLAAVMVTAELPAFARSGSRIDISISALGDASNLTGGTLLVTPLLAADGEVYAVGQGTLSTGAIAARGAAASSHARSHLGADRQRRNRRKRGPVRPRQEQRPLARPAQPRPDDRPSDRRDHQQDARPDRQGCRPAHGQAGSEQGRSDRNAGGGRKPPRRAGQRRHRGDR